MFRIRSRAWLALAVAVTLSGCASEVPRTSAILLPPGVEPQRIEIAQEVTVRFSSGYSRTLPAGSAWGLHGKIPEGAVYKRLNDVFTIEGTHVHEAYLVVSGNRLVGYYLPVERAFSPADPVPLNLK